MKMSLVIKNDREIGITFKIVVYANRDRKKVRESQSNGFTFQRAISIETRAIIEYRVRFS